MWKNKKKGFTTLEVIVVLGVLGILISIGAISYIGYIKQSQERLCGVNRATMMKMFHHQQRLNAKIVLDDTFLVGYTCPSKGAYYITDDEVFCTIHGNEEGGAGSDTELPEGTVGIHHTDGSIVNIKPGMTLDEIRKAIEANGSITLPEGTVIADGTGTYILGANGTFSSNNIGELTTLADVKKNMNMSLLEMGKEEDAVQGNADVFDYFYNESDFVLDRNGKWQLGALNYNELVSYGGKLYLTKSEIYDVKITPPNPTYYLEIIQ